MKIRKKEPLAKRKAKTRKSKKRRSSKRKRELIANWKTKAKQSKNRNSSQRKRGLAKRNARTRKLVEPTDKFSHCRIQRIRLIWSVFIVYQSIADL